MTAKYDHKSNNIKAKKIWKYVKFVVENMVLKFNKIEMWNVAFSTAATVIQMKVSASLHVHVGLASVALERNMKLSNSITIWPSNTVLPASGGT